MEKTTASDVYFSLRRLLRPTMVNRIIAYSILLNLAVYYLRPEDTLKFLGTIRLPLLLGIVPALAWAARSTQGWTFQTKLIMIFLLVEGARTLAGKLIWDDLVRNDYWALNTWKDLFLQDCTLVFPLVVYFANGQLLRSFLRVWLLTAFLLSIYVVHHGGMGSGAFLADENDTGLALLVFLPFPLAYLTETRFSGMKRMRYFLVTAVTLIAIVATDSRGAFVGLMCVLAYFFWRSRRKLLLLFAGSFLFMIVVAFIPKDYVTEIKSIKNTHAGTAETRRHYWKLAFKVWRDPKHILIGVGLGNVTFHLGDYETAADLEAFPSAAGRAVHSLYFQILPDLGIWGVIVVGTLFLKSFRTNWRLYHRTESEFRRLSGGRTKKDQSEAEEYRVASIEALLEEFDFIKPMIMAVNLGFVSVLTAGAFISVLYYPMFWILCGLSGLLERYSTSLFTLGNQLEAA